MSQFSFDHPDYDPDDMLITDLAEQSPMFTKMLDGLTNDIAELNEPAAKQWLGTLLINGKPCQVQLVVTSTDFVDEG
jgi:hypothetical protein